MGQVPNLSLFLHRDVIIDLSRKFVYRNNNAENIVVSRSIPGFSEHLVNYVQSLTKPAYPPFIDFGPSQ